MGALSLGEVGRTVRLNVQEVAWRRERKAIKWRFMVWDVCGHGVRFLDCTNRAEAMDVLPVEQGMAAVQHTPGVYHRADSRPRKIALHRSLHVSAHLPEAKNPARHSFNRKRADR